MTVSIRCLISTIQISALIVICLAMVAGCHHRSKVKFVDSCSDCASDFQQIEYPDVCDAALDNPSDLLTAPPPTILNIDEQEPWPMTLEEAIEMALANSQVLTRLGGLVVSAPQGAATVFDPAIQATDPFGSAEAALSDFDAQFTSSLNWSHTEREFNNAFAGFGQNTRTFDVGNIQAALSKISAAGTEFSISNNNDYNRNPDFQFLFDPLGNQVGERFKSYWDSVVQFEARQPLLRGAGTAVNRIAGPNALPGQYNGVLIGRIRNDVALADFEAAVRDLVRDVEQNYWELYFAYREFDVRVRAREAARGIWDNRKKRVDAGLSRPDDEAQTRQQYYQFAQQAINALSGGPLGRDGVLGSERQLRRLLGLLNNDGRLIRPITDPTIAPVRFDWDSSQQKALVQRVELRRQKWFVRQRELELYAARKLNKWDLDLVGNYGTRGFGNNLFGNAGAPPSVQTVPFVPAPSGRSSVANLFTGRLDEYSIGMELRGPVGLRQGHLAVRNAELQLVREKTLLREQQQQLLLDLNAAYAEIDRSFVDIRTSYNELQAAFAELEPKRKRVEAGDEDVFFLLDAQQRTANSASLFHRAVVDYNLALQNFVYTSGGLLQHYRIRLAEGEWNECAKIDATRKRSKFKYGPADPNSMDICPLGEGIYEPGGDLPFESSLDSTTDFPSQTAQPNPPDEPMPPEPTPPDDNRE